MKILYWRLVQLWLDINKKWCEYKLIRKQNKILKINYKIAKTYEELIELKKNPMTLKKALLWCVFHPISFIRLYGKEVR